MSMRMYAVAERAAERARARAGRFCPVCREPVKAQRSTRWYCSVNCRVKAHRNGGGTRTKKEGLRPAQVRILDALAKVANGGCIIRSQIGERAGVSVGWLSVHIGQADLMKRAASEAKYGFPSLLTLKLVKDHIRGGFSGDVRKERCYEITVAGVEALEKVRKAASAK